VFDRRDVAAGASAGNAGWISPAMVAPLPESSVLRYGLVSLLRPASPLRMLGSRASYSLRIGDQKILQPLDFVQSLARRIATGRPEAALAPAAGAGAQQVPPGARLVGWADEPCRRQGSSGDGGAGGAHHGGWPCSSAVTACCTMPFFSSTPAWPCWC
jgi:D-amino-acid dehydrogenase